jgi:penicillin-binding protein 2
MASIEQHQKPSVDLRTLILPILVGIGVVAVFFRLWYLQVYRGEELSRQATSKRTLSVPFSPPRGIIVDRTERVLAGLRPRLSLLITPVLIENNENAMKRLSKIVGISVDDLNTVTKENLYRRYLPFVAKVDITYEQAISIEEQKAFIPGVSVRPASIRDYPYSTSTAHVVGYVGATSQEDLNRIQKFGHWIPSFIGKVGAERGFDAELLGRPGRESVEVDSRGKPIGTPIQESAVPGLKVKLTIDAELQKYVTKLLANRPGAVVVMDPRSGEIHALVSSPTYDPNLFARRISRQDWTKLSKNAKLPMHNRAIGSAYAPGSTFKMVTLIAAIRAGVVGPSTTFVCNGSIKIGNRTFRCEGRHGRIDYDVAISKSCNVFFGELAKRLKREQILTVAHEFGFGEKLGVEIPGERGGIMPTDEFLQSRNLKWYPGDTINFSVGQGFTAATPLQMAHYACVLANGGYAFKPRLLKAIESSETSTIEEVKQSEKDSNVQLDTLWWERIRRSMKSVVETGTGRRARIEGVEVAGKTGSAEHGKNMDTHSWFIGYAPADNPRVAVAVVLEAAGHGGDIAAPIAKEIIAKVLQWAKVR